MLIAALWSLSSTRPQFSQENSRSFSSRVFSYDYRGIGGSKPQSLRGFQALARDWAKDMSAVIDWVEQILSPEKIIIIGHSIGGQMMGLLENADKVDAMITASAQSGYWGMQGGNQKYAVAFHMYVTFPLLTHLLGYMPWSSFSSAEDLPKGVALEWARWCRNPKYLLGDKTLPLERYAQFQAPILAYSIDDDNWGTAPAVDAMMSAYPNVSSLPKEVFPS
jgi:predicted alpha/beta hydrolase